MSDEQTDGLPARRPQSGSQMNEQSMCYVNILYFDPITYLVNWNELWLTNSQFLYI